MSEEGTPGVPLDEFWEHCLDGDGRAVMTYTEADGLIFESERAARAAEAAEQARQERERAFQSVAPTRRAGTRRSGL